MFVVSVHQSDTALYFIVIMNTLEIGTAVGSTISATTGLVLQGCV